MSPTPRVARYVRAAGWRRMCMAMHMCTLYVIPRQRELNMAIIFVQALVRVVYRSCRGIRIPHITAFEALYAQRFTDSFGETDLSVA